MVTAEPCGNYVLDVALNYVNNDEDLDERAFQRQGSMVHSRGEHLLRPIPL